ncbi:hypothetical protein C2G38_2123475 [Gigaspora rosea]|uniref:Uncharacterized protein n=1 Tax=Gigaspora rosea TaxID=44941 RepID=A0A397U3A8_9GLOM|nr:hypothetical protein C2G38_2123475 [Gigaspora rosea]
MTRTYICQYLTNERKICGRPCYRQEGCAIHWKRRQRIPCLECGKPTASKYSLCNLHADKCYAKAFYYRNKLSKMVQNGQTIESLTRIPDKTDTGCGYPSVTTNSRTNRHSNDDELVNQLSLE